MPLTSSFERFRQPRLESAVILLAITLSAYFGIVYALSFSPAIPASRQGIHAAILTMDVLILAYLARIAGTLLRILRPGAGLHGWFRLLLSSIGAASLLYVAFLHGDYALAR